MKSLMLSPSIYIDYIDDYGRYTKKKGWRIERFVIYTWWWFTRSVVSY